MGSTIDFSAQFGGRDAADAVLPHFKALKKAALDTDLPDFPLPKLVFILRVDGTVSTYGFRGLGNIAIDKRGKYVSVDIGLATKDRDRLKGRRAQNSIVDAIIASVTLLTQHYDERLRGVDPSTLTATLRTLCERYAGYLAE